MAPDDLDVLENLLSFYMRAVTHTLSRDLDARLAGLEVAKGTGKITALLLIDSHPGIRASAISEATLRDRPSMSRLLTHLEAVGLIEQRVEPGERRARGLYITARGHAVSQEVRKITRAQSTEFFAVLDEDDQSHLMRITRKLYHHIREGLA
ncbi:MarR family winged helix-turn-helix transcriptional regulator [Palleronia aestuarii]|uniref:MarR family winged helix-turn-helix transcriptional regulator n=1 Tax=Palleronia aestuarii TaxID=568105 RepID=UPI001F4638D2|nr:MarR family winged helix-turn-helix transcriptional regulator [Palleronia aestuarii]